VIANCPGCGTHFKHEPPPLPVRARCGRCDTALDLSRFRPYRIVPEGPPSPADARRAATHLPIGLDHPALATTIAHHVTHSVAASHAPTPPDFWDVAEPLPQIPEMAVRGAFPSAVLRAADGDILVDEEPAGASTPTEPRLVGPQPESTGGSIATFSLWVAAGAIAGTGSSWTAGGTTIDGLALGAALGAIAGWGWLRWTSPK